MRPRFSSISAKELRPPVYHEKRNRGCTSPTMTRRLVRTGLQLGSFLVILILLIFILDNRYRVLPKRLHALSPIHHPGLVVTDITLTTCSTISVLSSCTLAAPWQRIEKDLYLDKGWFSHAYLHVQRKKEEELGDIDRVVMDVRVGRLRPGEEDWESRPGGIWLLRSSKRHDSDSSKAITAVDVLFGADAVEPRSGWQVKDQSLSISADRSTPEPRITVRSGAPKTPAKPKPRMNKDGKFKVLQVSDTHLSTGLGVCRDEFPETPHCEADPRTLEFIGAMLDLENPDLVVLSGDQINGETAPDAQTALYKLVELFISRHIPYAFIFGNHDDEGSLSRQELMNLAQDLPLSLSEPGPSTIDGMGNYYLEILAKGTSSHSAITLWLLDTHAYSPDEAHYKGYDWLKPSQIAWFRETASSLHSSPAHKEYAHHHLDMAFIHIPLPEYREPEALIPSSGEWREAPTAPGFNSGFKDALVEHGVFGVSCGHDHVNDYCALATHSNPASLPADRGDEARKLAEKGRLWMCYAGGSGYGGYGGYGGYKRRVRVWEFEMSGSVQTWKRVDGDEGKKDVRYVVERGQVVGKE